MERCKNPYRAHRSIIIRDSENSIELCKANEKNDDDDDVNDNKASEGRKW